MKKSKAEVIPQIDNSGGYGGAFRDGFGVVHVIGPVEFVAPDRVREEPPLAGHEVWYQFRSRNGASHRRVIRRLK